MSAERSAARADPAAPAAPAAPMRPELIEKGLFGTRFAGRLHHATSLTSTIDECRRLADEGAPEGTVVLAEEQRRGRGQRGRSWHSPRGRALYLTALLRPEVPPELAQALVKLAGLAALSAVREVHDLPLVLKAPNDLLVLAGDGRPRKVGGLLVDTAVQGPRLRHALVSLGLNVSQELEDLPAELRQHASSLRLAAGASCSREELAAAFLRQLDRAACDLVEGRLEGWLARWAAEARELEDFQVPAWHREDTT